MALPGSPCLPCVARLAPAPGPLHVPCATCIQQLTGSLSPLGPPERPSQHSPQNDTLPTTCLCTPPGFPPSVSRCPICSMLVGVSPLPGRGPCLLQAETLVPQPAPCSPGSWWPQSGLSDPILPPTVFPPTALPSFRFPWRPLLEASGLILVPCPAHLPCAGVGVPPCAPFLCPWRPNKGATTKSALWSLRTTTEVSMP